MTAVDADGAPNPLAGHERAYMYGASLSARVIRQFIYDGYNVDPQGRKVFAAAYPHVSGAGRLVHECPLRTGGALPTPARGASVAVGALPVRLLPSRRTPSRTRLDCVMKRPGADPLVVHTHTNTEYWIRHASLGHTDPEDRRRH